jgi:hypothetical protein
MTPLAVAMTIPSSSIFQEIEEGSIWVGFGIHERHERPSFVVFSCAEIF